MYPAWHGYSVTQHVGTWSFSYRRARTHRPLLPAHLWLSPRACGVDQEKWKAVGSGMGGGLCFPTPRPALLNVGYVGTTLSHSKKLK